MLIHFISALVELHVVVEADAESDRKTDGRPERVTAANPVPEFEHVSRIDTESGNGFGVRGECHEVLCNSLFVTVESLEDSFLCRLSVRHGFESRERLGSHDEEGFFEVDLLQGFGHVRAVDVRNEENGRRIFAFSRLVCVRLESFGHHDRTEVRTADTDVHHVLDGLARVALPLTGTDELREFFHVLEHSANFRHHILAVDANRIVTLVTESGVKNCTLFRGIDLFATKILGADFFELSALQEVLEHRHRFVINQVLGVVEENAASFCTELFSTLRVFGEHFAHVPLLGFLSFRFEGLPFIRFCQTAHNVSL